MTLLRLTPLMQLMYTSEPALHAWGPTQLHILLHHHACCICSMLQHAQKQHYLDVHVLG